MTADLLANDWFFSRVFLLWIVGLIKFLSLPQVFVDGGVEEGKSRQLRLLYHLPLAAHTQSSGWLATNQIIQHAGELNQRRPVILK